MHTCKQTCTHRGKWRWGQHFFKASATNSNHLTNQRVKWCIPPPPQPPFLPSFGHISKHLYHFSSGGTWKEPRGPWRSLSASKIFKLQTIFLRAGKIFKWNIEATIQGFLKKILKLFIHIDFLSNSAHFCNTYQQQQRISKNGTTLCFKSPDHLWGDGNQCCPGDAAELWLFVLLMVAADLQAFLLHSRQINSIALTEKRCCDIDLPNWWYDIRSILRGIYLKGQPSWASR